MSEPKVAIITGAARGIGRATAERLHQDGFSLVLSGRSRDELELLESELTGSRVVIGDIREEATPATLVSAAIEGFGRLDALVNAAGIAKMAPLLEIDLETWQGFFDLHVTATYRCGQAAAKAMVAQGHGGSIVNIGSIAASMAMYGTGAYAAAKGAVASFSRVFAVELAATKSASIRLRPGQWRLSNCERCWRARNTPNAAEASR